MSVSARILNIMKVKAVYQLKRGVKVVDCGCSRMIWKKARGT